MNPIIKLLNETSAIILQPSSINGVGVFANQDIPSGVSPFYPIDEWVEISKNDFQDLNDAARTLVERYGVKDEAGNWCALPDPRRVDLIAFLNGSNSPNIFADDQSFTAIRDIRKGEELTIDYTKVDAEGKNE